MSVGALDGVRIVDLGGSIAGMAATMVLADVVRRAGRWFELEVTPGIRDMEPK